MPSTFLGIETSRRALQAHQKSMETTGHNISNANTPGYSRQQAVMSASAPYANPTFMSKLTPGQLGTGVEINEIRRVRNEYLDAQARNSTSSLGYWQIQENMFARIESVFPEPGASGIGDAMTKFFRTWHDLNNTPEDPGIKAAVAEVGDELATMMKETYQQLNSVSKSSIDQMESQVNTVNNILMQIRDVTKSIVTIYNQGNQPNDLLDKRDYLIDQLAVFGSVSFEHLTVNGKPTGDLNLSFMGVDVMSKDVSFKLDPNQDLIPQADGQDLATVVDLAVDKGSLAGIKSILKYVESYQSDLNELAFSLINTINKITNIGTNGYSFFDENNVDLTNAAEIIKVNQSVLDNPVIIDGTKALYVARLFSKGIETGTELYNDGSITVSIDAADNVNLDGATFNEYYNRLLSKIGAESGKTTDMVENQDAINQQVESLRQSVAGVNMDEELSLMIQFQYGYQASARVMSTLDQMLDHLINRTAV